MARELTQDRPKDDFHRIGRLPAGPSHANRVGPVYPRASNVSNDLPAQPSHSGYGRRGLSFLVWIFHSRKAPFDQDATLPAGDSLE